jgi:cell division protein FtsL
MDSRAMAAVLAVLLMASALALVTSQYRARGLFAELDVAQQQAAQGELESNRLRLELGRATQPAAIEAAARQLGLRPIDADHMALLPVAVRRSAP